MLKLYQALTTILAPLISFYLLRRKLRGKEDILRFDERLGNASKARPNGKLIWVHAASVGESISILPLIEKLAETKKETNFLITTGTVTSAKLIAGRLPSRTIHQYVPVDRLPYVKSFLNHWKPDLALWVESELWPNLITSGAKICPMILINGRMSDSSFKTWRKYSNFISKLLSSFVLCLPQSKQDGERFEALGAKNVKYCGNIKYDAPTLPANKEALAELEKSIGVRKIWLAASTHKGEEEIIATIHKELQVIFPDILTIIVPRHPNRTEQILGNIDKDILVSVRSKDNKITNDTGIYLADTMGELGIFFRLSKIVFIGNSLVPNGGHNPLEPARLGCAVIVGPHMFNFDEINNELVSKNAIITIQNQQELKSTIVDLIKNPEKSANIISSSLALVQEKNHILDNIIKEIEIVDRL